MTYHLHSDPTGEPEQTSDIVFTPSQEPAFADGLSHFVLNPGDWVVQINTADDSIFLVCCGHLLLKFMSFRNNLASHTKYVHVLVL